MEVAIFSHCLCHLVTKFGGKAFDLTIHTITLIVKHTLGVQKSGFPPYLENLEFCLFFFQAWKMPGIYSKSGKNLEF